MVNLRFRARVWVVKVRVRVTIRIRVRLSLVSWESVMGKNNETNGILPIICLSNTNLDPNSRVVGGWVWFRVRP